MVQTTAGVEHDQGNDDAAGTLVEPRRLHHNDVGSPAGIAADRGVDVEMRHQRLEYSSPQVPNCSSCSFNARTVASMRRYLPSRGFRS